jgi:hypothetical protein
MQPLYRSDYLGADIGIIAPPQLKRLGVLQRNLVLRLQITMAFSSSLRRTRPRRPTRAREAGKHLAISDCGCKLRQGIVDDFRRGRAFRVGARL